MTNHKVIENSNQKHRDFTDKVLTNAKPASPIRIYDFISSERLMQKEKPNKDIGAEINQLEISRDKYAGYFKFSPVGLVLLDRNGIVHDINIAGSKLLGIDKEIIVTRELLQYVNKDSKNEYLSILQRAFLKNEKISGEVTFINSMVGSIFSQMECSSLDEGKSLQAFCLAAIIDISKFKTREDILKTEVTERMQYEAQFKFLSFHDKLTGLYNRNNFEDSVAMIDNESDLPISIIMGDVNNLKLSNDTFGHAEGDKLLIKIAEILRSVCRPKDFIYRWGGDEFVILLPETDRETAIDISKRIKQLCNQAQGTLILPSISIGVATKTSLNQEIYKILRTAEDIMYKHKSMENESNQNATVSSLVDMLERKSPGMKAHISRLATFIGETGTLLGLNKTQIEELTLLAKYHEIGKIVTPERILLKKEPLTPTEWKLMEKHTEIGYRIARSYDKLAHVADIILAHHEKWDGTGYPKKLKGRAIPFLARVFSIFNAFDVMINGSMYKSAMNTEQALNEIKKGAGSQFDPEISQNFIEVVFSHLAAKNTKNPLQEVLCNAIV